MDVVVHGSLRNRFNDARCRRHDVLVAQPAAVSRLRDDLFAAPRTR